MPWIFERFGLRGSLMGAWVVIKDREEHPFEVAGNKGYVPVVHKLTVPSLGFDMAVFAKYGPLLVDIGVSPSWLNTHNAMRYQSMMGVAIPVGRNSELRILGGYRKFFAATTNATPEITESSGVALQVDLAALLGEKGALVMAAHGNVAKNQEDIQPAVSLGGEYLIAGQYELVHAHSEAEHALERARTALKAAQDIVSEEHLQAELTWYGKFDDEKSAGLDVIERAAQSLVNLKEVPSRKNHDELSESRDRAYAAAKYAAGYAVSDSTKEEAQSLIKKIYTMRAELKLQLAHFIAKDVFKITDGIVRLGHQTKKWIGIKNVRTATFAKKLLDQYAKNLDRFQLLISEFTEGDIELIDILADTSQTIRCLQGKGVNCAPELMAISYEQLAKELSAKNVGGQ